jgi:hypothetical protein
MYKQNKNSIKIRPIRHRYFKVIKIEFGRKIINVGSGDPKLIITWKLLLASRSGLALSGLVVTHARV